MKIDDLSRNQRNIIAILEKVKEGTTSELIKELELPRRTFLDNIKNFGTVSGERESQKYRIECDTESDKN